MSAGRRPRGALLAALSLSLALVVAQVIAERGPLIAVDVAAGALALEQRWPALHPVAKAFELLGQRSLVYAVVAVAVAAVAWASRTWRPVLVLAAALLTLNIVVGAAKVLTGRPKPFTGDLGVFSGGIIFPSGHAANVVLAWGILCYLLARYGSRAWPRRAMAAGVAAAALAMGSASVYLNTHWITDLLAGWLVGAWVLQAAVILDSRPAALRRRRPARPPPTPEPRGLPARPPAGVAASRDAPTAMAGRPHSS